MRWKVHVAAFTGRLFQNSGAAEQSLLQPAFMVLCGGTERRPVVIEWRGAGRGILWYILRNKEVNFEPEMDGELME